MSETNMDLSIFKEDDDECDEQNEDVIGGCNAINRLVKTLKYYALLDIIESKDNQDIFAAFMSEVYFRFLDDFAHLINEHDNLEQIHKRLREMKLFDECDVRKCQFTSRHHSVGAKKIVSMDPILTFYAKTMDALHFYLFHLFECGLRTQKMSDIDICDDEKKDNNDDIDNKYLDRQFMRISRMINERKHLSLSFNRFKSNSKFNIAINDTASSSSTTFMEELFRRLLYKNIKETAIKTLRDFIGTNKYDSDSLQADFNPNSDAIIAANMEDKELIETVRDFVTSTAIRSSSFNIGLIWYYWAHYKDMEEFDENTNKHTLNDHSGYAIRELFVRKTYLDFKEEMSNYGFLNMEQMKELNIKVRQYMQTKNVKKRKVKKQTSKLEIKLKYGLTAGSGILYRHLLSLFLYTDFTELSNDFSSTFRAKKQFESLAAIKARNSKYWWMAMSLREIVEIFGDSYWSNLRGPFYCGLTVVMPFPEFELRLCGPTSTTKAIEIATTFAGRDGTILQVNNNIHFDLSGFKCAAFSNFAEEAEILFMGGHYRIKIESVRILNGKGGECLNFEQFFGALAKFNKIFNGYCIRTKELSADEKEIISTLFNWSFGVCDLKDEFDEYVVQTFMSFRENKQHIVFNYYSLSGYCDKDLIAFLFYGMKFGADFKPSKEEKTNIFGKGLFQLFPNIKNIDIYTTGNTGDTRYQCALSFEALLSEIEKETFNQITVKAVQPRDKNESWISLLWETAQKDLKQKYKQKGYQILVKNTKNERNRDEDCVVIKKL